MFKKIGYAAALIALVPLAACQKAEQEVPQVEATESVEVPATEMPAEEPTSEAAK